jgi:hypothetical protein
MSEFVRFPIGTVVRRAEIHAAFGGQERFMRLGFAIVGLKQNQAELACCRF